jgi:polysaccharide export outer membrane protein
MNMEFTLNTSFTTLARRVTKLMITTAIASAIALPISVSAQQISAEQLAQFKKLPKAQQEALAKQYGVDLSTLNMGAGTANQQITNPEVVTPKAVDTAKIIEEDIIEQATEDSTVDKKESRNEALELDMFGYDLFAGVPTTFAPATDIPLPGEYIVGPGDNINLNLYGKTNSQLTVVVDREGKINVPELGPIHVAGLSFQELKAMMKEEVKQRAIGLSVLTTLGELRSVRIFILGEANRPGSYTVSSLSTITNALFVSGGIKKTGSLRNIELKRNGKLVSTFDLYDLLLRGDTSDDVRVLPGDVIFVPPVGNTVGIGGEVKRSAIFELKDETTFADLVSLSGGFLPTTFLPATKVNRIDSQGQRIVLDMDLSQSSNLSQRLNNGDLVRVFSILDSLEDVVTVEGHVYRPGNYAFNPGMDVADIIGDIKDVLPNVDLAYALIRRESPDTREIYFEQFALRDVFNGQTVPLAKRDKIIIFSNAGERDGLIAADIARLRGQTALNEPAKVVSVIGPVKQSGSYPLMEGMSVKQLLAAAGNLTLDAEEEYAVIIRTTLERDLSVLTVNLSNERLLATPLQAEDQLYVFSKNQDRADALAPVMARLASQATKDIDNQLITISGEVRFPGVYPYSTNMRIPDLVSAAGGLTESAYLDEMEISRFYTDKKTVAGRNTFIQTLSDEIANKTTALQAKDVVQIRRIPQWYEEKYVELSGEFTFPGRYLVRDGDSLKDVIERAGGFTDLAYPGAAVFIRESVATKNQQELKRLEKALGKQLEIAMAAKSMSATIGTQATALDMDKITNLIEPDDMAGLGRVAIDLMAQFSGEKDQVEVFPNDTLFVPRKPATVQILGEVQVNSAHVFDSELSLAEYLALAGGTTEFADDDAVYVIRADGRVVRPGNNWFSYADSQIQPGDTIVVPLDINLRDNLGLWQQVTQIIYNSAVAVAAIRSL